MSNKFNKKLIIILLLEEKFKTKEDSFEYLQLIDVFEDIFDEDLQYHN